MSLLKQGAVSHMVQLYEVELVEEEKSATPTAIANLLQEFEDIFGEPQGLPPRHNCDYRIPLMPGAQLVNNRPYRKNPENKTKIEQQI